MDLYAENILDHFKHPRGKKMLTSVTVEQEEVNRSCGDRVMIQTELDGETIVALGWSGEGCAISQAAMSLLAEALEGKTIGEIERLRPQDVRELLGVPISTRRLQCAMLSLHALKNLARTARGLAPQTFAETVAEDESDA